MIYFSVKNMHEITLPENTTKAAQYQALLPQIAALIADESDFIANLANVAAALKEAFSWLWVGFYLVDAVKNELVLGPFQGPVACTRIGFGKGVCGQAWQQQQTLVVSDVNAFAGHIACSSLSQSEIVVPLINDGEVIAVLDVDAATLAAFDNVDATYLEELVALLAKKYSNHCS